MTEFRLFLIEILPVQIKKQSGFDNIEQKWCICSFWSNTSRKIWPKNKEIEKANTIKIQFVKTRTVLQNIISKFNSCINSKEPQRMRIFCHYAGRMSFITFEIFNERSSIKWIMNSETNFSRSYIKKRIDFSLKWILEILFELWYKYFRHSSN
jgi:hypothetical protein